MLPVYVPFYQALLVHGIWQAILLLTLAVLMMFLVATGLISAEPSLHF